MLSTCTTSNISCRRSDSEKPLIMNRRRKKGLLYWIKYWYHCVINFFICLRYPFLKIDTTVYPWLKGYRKIWLDELEPGWRKRFGLALCEELRKFLKENNVKGYHVNQVKEKWGVLEWYDNWYELYNNYDIRKKILQKYSRLSSNTCVICGGNADHKSIRYVLPYCSKCHDVGDVCHYNVEYKGKKK